MSNRYSFFIPGPPQAKQRARSTRRGITYTPKETVNYEVLTKQMFAAEFPDFVMFGPKVAVRLCVSVFFPIPQSASKKLYAKMEAGTIRPTKRPDWDNLGKIVSDALNQILYHDDCQVCSATVLKFYSERPGVRVDFEEIE